MCELYCTIARIHCVAKEMEKVADMGSAVARSQYPIPIFPDNLKNTIKKQEFLSRAAQVCLNEIADLLIFNPCTLCKCMKVYLVELSPLQNRYSTIIRITERIR